MLIIVIMRKGKNNQEKKNSEIVKFQQIYCESKSKFRAIVMIQSIYHNKGSTEAKNVFPIPFFLGIILNVRA